MFPVLIIHVEKGVKGGQDELFCSCTRTPCLKRKALADSPHQEGVLFLTPKGEVSTQTPELHFKWHLKKRQRMLPARAVVRILRQKGAGAHSGTTRIGCEWAHAHAHSSKKMLVFTTLHCRSLLDFPPRASITAHYRFDCVNAAHRQLEAREKAAGQAESQGKRAGRIFVVPCSMRIMQAFLISKQELTCNLQPCTMFLHKHMCSKILKQ